MSRPSPSVSRNGERAIADGAHQGAHPDNPHLLPIGRRPRLLAAGTQRIPEGAHSFRVRAFEPGRDEWIAPHPSRAIQPGVQVTLVIDYLTEEQVLLGSIPIGL